VPADNRPRQFTPRYRPARLDGPGDVLPRFTVLPGDPPQLARWLAAQAREHGEGYLPADWPEEPPR